MYQYPPRIVSHPGDRHEYEFIDARVLWGSDHEENRIPADITPEELINRLADKFGISHQRRKDSFIKVVGEDSYLLGDYRIIDFEYVWERVAAKLVNFKSYFT